MNSQSDRGRTPAWRGWVRGPLPTALHCFSYRKHSYIDLLYLYEDSRLFASIEILRYYTETDKSEEHRKGKGDVSFRTIKSTTHDGKKFTVENENKVWQFEAEDFVEAADWLTKVT